MIRTLISLVVLLVILGPATASAAPADLLAVDSAFVAGQYAEAELLALRTLQDPKLSRDARARLNLTAGYAVIMLGRESEARQYFERALDAVPDLTLDPVLVSPRFRMVFDEVKAARQQPRHTEEVGTGPARGALLLNLVLPGSGQWRSGHRVRGAALFAAQAVTAGLLVASLGQMRDSRSDYLAETDPARMSSAYDRYNDDYRMAWVTGVAAGAVYLAAQADLVRLRPKPAAPQIALAPAPYGLRLACRW